MPGAAGTLEFGTPKGSMRKGCWTPAPGQGQGRVPGSAGAVVRGDSSGVLERHLHPSLQRPSATLGDKRPVPAVMGEGKAAGPQASDRPEQGEAEACARVLEDTLGDWEGQS